MPACPVSQLIGARHAYSIPPASHASISVSGICCPDDLREHGHHVLRRAYQAGTIGSRADPRRTGMSSSPSPPLAEPCDETVEPPQYRDGQQAWTERRCGRSRTMRRLETICVGARSAGKNMANWDGVAGAAMRRSFPDGVVSGRKSARVAGRRGIGERSGVRGGAAERRVEEAANGK